MGKSFQTHTTFNMHTSPTLLLFAVSLAVCSGSVPLPSTARTATGRLLQLRGGAIKTPKETYAAYAAFGGVQGRMGLRKTLLQSVMAGGYIALGAVLAMSVGG